MREEKQKMKSKLKDYKVDIFTLPYYIFALVVVLAGTFLDRIPGLGFCGGFALCTVFGILLFPAVGTLFVRRILLAQHLLCNFFII